MTILETKLAELLAAPGISTSKMRAWCQEATNRIERTRVRDLEQDARLGAVEARLKALEDEPSPPPVSTVGAPKPPVGPFTLMDGGFASDNGIMEYNPSGKTYEKLHIKNYRRRALGYMVWPAAEVAAPVTVRDCIFENVTMNPPMSSNGTAEACLWVGNESIVNRVKIRNGAWMGMWTGASCFDSVFEDIEISDCPSVGLYIEHDTKRCTFRNCKISARSNAVNIEWWYSGHGSNSLTFEDCWFHSDEGWGMFVDAGTYDVTIRNCKFTGKNGINLPQRLVDPSKPNKIDLASCDFSGVTGIKTSTHNNAIG